MLAHADETDDSHAPSLTHPGCGMVPAALAMAEAEEANGEALLRAVALGYDIGCRLTMSLDAYQFREDGHSTHSFGPMFGAAAAAAALARLNERQVRHCLSFTAQQASGISCWMRDEEHIEKAFDFGGMPARNGVAAARWWRTVLPAWRTRSRASAASSSLTGASRSRETGCRAGRDLRGDEHQYQALVGRLADPGAARCAPDFDGGEQIWSAGDRAADGARSASRCEHDEQPHMPDICMQHLCAVMVIDGTVSFKAAHDERRMRDRRF